MNINKANIANAIHSVAKDHVVVVANDIYDESREQYQSTLNEGVGLYEDNSEFVKVVTDFEGKILYAVRVDGDFYFGAGIPSQIQNLVNATEGTIDEKIALLEAELQRLDDVKVDKEEGKSLIPTQYIKEVEDNPEFVKVVLDSEDKILYGVKADGDFMFGCGVPNQIQEKLDEIYDTYGKYDESPEYVRVYLDAEGKILWGIKADGSIYFGAGIPPQVKEYLEQEIEIQNQKIDAEVQRAAAAEEDINNKIFAISNIPPKSEDEAIVLVTDDGKEVTNISARKGDDDNEVMEFKDNAGNDTYAKVGNIDGKKGIFAPGFYDLQGNPIQAFEIDTENEVMIINGRKYKLIPFVETT